MVGIYRLLQLLYCVYVFRFNSPALKVRIIIRHRLWLFPTCRGLVLILVMLLVGSILNRIWTGVEIQDGRKSRLQITCALLPLRWLIAVILILVIVSRVTTVNPRIEVQIFTAQTAAIIIVVFPPATPIRISYNQTDS